MPRNRGSALLLVFVLVVTALAGFAPGAIAETSAQPKKFDKVLELSLVILNYTDTPVVIPEDIVSPALTEATGIRWTSIEGLNGMDSRQRFNILVQSDSLPDVMVTDGGTIATDCRANDLIWTPSISDFETYAPEIANRLGPAERAVIMFDDDTFFGLPSMMSMSDYDIQINPDFPAIMKDWSTTTADYVKPYVRDDILKALYPSALSYDELFEKWKASDYTVTLDDILIPELKTGDDFLNLLRDIKALELQENAKPVIPFVSDRSFFIDGVSRLEGFFTSWSVGWFNSNTLKMDLWWDKPYFKAAYQKWNQAAREGLFDPNGIVMKSDQLGEAMNAGQYAVVSGSSFGATGINLQTLNDSMAALEKPFKYRPVFFDIKRHNDYPGFYPTARGCSQYYLLNKNTIAEEDLPQIYNWANFQLTQEGVELTQYGPESAGLWALEDGKRVFNTPELQNSMLNMVNIPGEKGSLYYGMPNGSWDGKMDYRFYSYYNQQYSPYSPRVQAWPLPKQGTTEEFLFDDLPLVGAKQIEWQFCDVAGAFSFNDPEFGAAMTEYMAVTYRLDEEITPKLIFAGSDEEFEKFYQRGHDMLNENDIWPNYESNGNRVYEAFHAKFPDLKPYPWPQNEF